MDKIKSGIEGFDKLLFGGFPAGRAYLISGEPGTGKTIFSLQYLLEGIENGQTGIYVSIDELPEHVIMDAEALGWNIRQYLQTGQLKFLDVSSYFDTSSNLKKDALQMDGLIEDIINFIKSNGSARVAIDPVAPLIFAEKNIPEVVEYIRRLILALETTGTCTTLLTSYVPVGSSKVSQHGVEEFAASGIIVLRLVKSKNKYIRTVWVRKMRGTRIDLTEYSFEILPNRGVVLRQPV